MPNRSELQTTHDEQGRRIYRKGIMRQIRTAKRAEAETRNADSPERKRRSYWRERGFSRESDAARVVRQAVAEGNVISRTIIPDLADAA